ncbi:MAG: hypothetical protein ACTSWD_02430 [Candidatus Heimdallarchaeota archaeon]
MLETALTEKQLEFCELYYDPTAMTECLIPINLNAPQNWPNANNICVRPYQYPMQNYSYLYPYDSNLSDAENMRIKKGAGDVFNIGARNIGKSFFLKIDMMLAYVHAFAEICLSSFDDYHLRKIATPIADILENHKFAKVFHLRESRKNSVQRNPLNAKTEHGCTIESANEHVKGNNPGEQFHAKHFDYFAYEEYSYASDEGSKKRIDSGNSLGYIFRPSGIPDLCVGSPLGKILQDKAMKNWICRMPQLVREDWNEKVEEKISEEYGGKLTAGYKLNALAETIPGAFGLFDMERLESASVKKSTTVKFFEISKDNFALYDSIIHIDRVPGTEQIYISADLGFGSAPTEIAIIFYDGKKYKYMYNISLLRLTPEEQPEIFKYLYDKLGGAFIALDSTSDSGAMIDRLFKMGVDQEHLSKVRFNENIEVGFEKDKEGFDLCDDKGNPIMKKIGTEDWSYKELERIMYNGEMLIPYDAKFINQFTNIIATKTKGAIRYGSKGANHLVQAFQCFAICRFFNEFKSLRDTRNKPRSYGVFT